MRQGFEAMSLAQGPSRHTASYRNPLRSRLTEARIHDRLHGEREQHEGQGGDDDQQPRRDYPPPVAEIDRAGLQSRLKHLRPGRLGLSRVEERAAGAGTGIGADGSDLGSCTLPRTTIPT